MNKTLKKLIVLTMCAALLISGCGKGTPSESKGNESGASDGANVSQGANNTDEVQIIQDDFHGISYQVPNNWVKDSQADSDAVYYAPTGENDDIVIMLLYTDFSGKNVYSVYDVRQVYEKMIEGLKGTSGITDLKEDYRDLNGNQVGVAEYKQSSGDNSFSAVQYFFALPVYEGLFTCGYVVRDGVQDDYRDDYMNLLESVVLPAVAS